MKTLNRNHLSLYGIILLVCLFAPTMNAFAASCTASDELERLKAEAKKRMNSECNRSKEVDGGEKCLKSYKATMDAIGDNETKASKACAAAERARIRALAATKGQNSSGSANGAVGDNAANIRKDQAKANKGLAKWLRETAQEAAQRARELSSQGGEPDSGVSEAIRENQQAEKFANDAADKLEKEASLNEQQAKEFSKNAAASKAVGSEMNSAPTSDTQAKAPETAQQGQEGGAGGASGSGGAPSIPSMPGGDSGASGVASAPPSFSSPMDGQGSLDPETNMAKTSSGSGKSSAHDLKMDATPKIDSAANLMAEGPQNSSGSSKLDTSLRDSLKKKLLSTAAEPAGSGDALGGMPFGGGGAGAGKDGKPVDLVAAGAGGLTVPGESGDFGGGGVGESGDFSMARSETDAAVKNLINEFKGSDESLDGGRDLADTENAALSGIEGENGGNLFRRIRGTITRHLQNGDVVNGVNGKI